MIEFEFESQAIKLPTAWPEVSVKMFSTPEFLSGDSLKLLSALSGIPIAQLANTTEDLSPYFSQCVAFIAKDPNGWRGSEEPAELLINGSKCLIPKDLEKETYGQSVLFAQAIARAGGKYYQVLPELIAIYLAPQLFPLDWFDRIEEATALINPLPIHEVHTIADFFLNSSLLLAKNGLGPLMPYQTQTQTRATYGT